VSDYQGYKNYETFLVDVCYGNEEEKYHDMRALARSYIAEELTGLEADRTLREMVEDEPDVRHMLNSPSLGSSLLNAALDAVDWRELTELWARREREA
jgi:hypothetical protein